jgi:hypothetical protein
VAAAAILLSPAIVAAQEPEAAPAADDSNAARILTSLGGAAVGLLTHEAGHFALDVTFDAEPRFRRVEFANIPFFAITHRAGLSPRREYAITAAGFWVQNALAEWVLTHDPGIRRQRAPFAKGLLAWSAASSAVYTVAAFGRIGPPERDTRGMAEALGVSERWIGALVLAPAACDAWRYLNPDARWARWLSRASKAAMIVIVLAARH